MNRKELKKRAHASVKKHYWVFLFVCLLGAFLGTDHQDILELFETRNALQVSEAAENISTTTGLSITQGETNIFSDFLAGEPKESLKAVRERLKALEGEDTHIGDIELGHSRGVLASIVNSYSSGALLLMVLTTVDTIMGSPRAAVIVFALAGFLIIGLFWTFIVNTYRIVIKRFFLEGRLYERLPARRFTYLFRVKKMGQASLTMMLYAFVMLLGIISMVGYPVLRYMYFLTPYIAAENPGISAREAMRMSRKMMKGHKWEAFLLDATLIPWRILSFMTLGLGGIFYSAMYIEAVFSEYHVYIRSCAIEAGLEGTEKLCDRYLFEKPEHAVLVEAYADVKDIEETMPSTRKGFWGFAERNLGLILSFDQKEKEYREWARKRWENSEYLDALSGKTYPSRFYIFPQIVHRKTAADVDYMRHYSLPVVILMFFNFCIFGWIWEVSLHMLQTGTFVNRGMLHGPWLPIYGTGGIVILLSLYRLRSRPAVEFVSMIVLCGIIEYTTSVVMEKLHGQMWWDYSGYFLNLNGRICAEGLLVFGIGGMAVVYIVAPVIDNMLEQVPRNKMWPVCIALLLAFGVDTVYSSKYPNTGAGVTDTSGEISQIESGKWLAAADHSPKT